MSDILNSINLTTIHDRKLGKRNEEQAAKQEARDRRITAKEKAFQANSEKKAGASDKFP